MTDPNPYPVSRCALCLRPHLPQWIHLCQVGAVDHEPTRSRLVLAVDAEFWNLEDADQRRAADVAARVMVQTTRIPIATIAATVAGLIEGAIWQGPPPP